MSENHKQNRKQSLKVNINFSIFVISCIILFAIIFDGFFGTKKCSVLTVAEKHHIEDSIGDSPKSWQLYLEDANDEYGAYYDVTISAYDKVSVGSKVTVCESPLFHRLLDIKINNVNYGNSGSYINVLFYFLFPLTVIPVVGYMYKLIRGKKND